MVELNPNHPVTREVHEHWHKVVALMMVHFGLKEFRITKEMIASMPHDLAVAFDVRAIQGGDAVVRLISMTEAEDMARKEGGLPI